MTGYNEADDNTGGGRPSLHQARASLAEAIDNVDERDAQIGCIEQGTAQDDTAEKNDFPATALGSSSDDDDKTLVGWDEKDPKNPYNWSKAKKTFILITAMMIVINSTMGSALPSQAIPYLADEFGVTSEEQHVLPISVFLIGYVFGPMLWGPLSEHFGRRLISLGTFTAFSIWTMACALAPNFASLIVFRLFTGVFASSAIAVVPGILADVFGDHRTRGRAMAVFMASTCFGPIFAPIISGFCSTTIGWRWTFWIGLIYAGITFVPVLITPETFAPVLLDRRAARLRKIDPVANADVRSPRDLDPSHSNKGHLVSVVLTRPLRMMMSELIVSCTCAYLALVYAIFYMSFQAFPLIFGDLYGLSPGETGLAFLPIGGGSIIALPIFFAYEPFLAWAQRQGPTESGGTGRHTRLAAWSRREEARRLPLACVGGPLFVASLFWLGFTADPSIAGAGPGNVPFAVPMLAGLPFGAGFMLIFMALLNYLTDAYEIFAASAHAAASMARSLVAVVLPLATNPMFRRLGVAGACALLGGLSALMCVIPFVFIWKGETLRAGSKFCLALRERKEEAARKDEERTRRKEARSAAAAAVATAPTATAGGCEDKTSEG